MIDPERVIFTDRQTRVWSYHPMEAKRVDQVLQNSYNKNDFVIIDRLEHAWEHQLQSKMIIIKTFAPLSGLVITEASLKFFPIRVNLNVKNHILEKPMHITLASEAKGDLTLKNLHSKLEDAYDQIVDPSLPI